MTTALKSVERLILYQRLLRNLSQQKVIHVYSHELAALANNTSAQVRRDLMQIGYSGNPVKGYVVDELLSVILDFLEPGQTQKIALVGVGNLGRAILSYFSYQQPYLDIVAAFDIDPIKVNRVLNGCRCYPVADLDKVVEEKDISIGIITVPGPNAQETANRLVDAGVKGILNFSPLPIRVPENIVVDHLDITMKLKKIAFLCK